MIGGTYLASPVKRHRATKAEIVHRRNSLFEIISEMKPMTVRQVFYQAAVRHIVEKSEAGYNKVQTDLVLMRRAALEEQIEFIRSIARRGWGGWQ
jgi:hypothetical protein